MVLKDLDHRGDLHVFGPTEANLQDALVGVAEHLPIQLLEGERHKVKVRRPGYMRPCCLLQSFHIIS